MISFRIVCHLEVLALNMNAIEGEPYSSDTERATVGGSSLVIRSIPIGTGTMVLRCFLFSGSVNSPGLAVAASPEIVGSNPSCNLVWLECSSRKWLVFVRGHAPWLWVALEVVHL